MSKEGKVEILVHSQREFGLVINYDELNVDEAIENKIFELVDNNGLVVIKNYNINSQNLFSEKLNTNMYKYKQTLTVNQSTI